MTIEQAVDSLAKSSVVSSFRYIVTPNVDHVVRLHYGNDAEVRQAYDSADLCLCDSRVIAALGWVLGVKIETVTGSDLIAAFVHDRFPPEASVTLIGGDDDTLIRLRKILPRAKIQQQQPPMNLRTDSAAMHAVARFIIDNPADFVLIAVGSPQQEMIAYRAAKSGQAKGTAVCIGAAIDFLTGRKQRAPRILRVLGLEWLHRLFSEPQRLWRRYLIRSPRVFVIAAKWYLRHRFDK